MYSQALIRGSPFCFVLLLALFSAWTYLLHWFLGTGTIDRMWETYIRVLARIRYIPAPGLVQTSLLLVLFLSVDVHRHLKLVGISTFCFRGLSYKKSLDMSIP